MEMDSSENSRNFPFKTWLRLSIVLLVWHREMMALFFLFFLVAKITFLAPNIVQLSTLKAAEGTNICRELTLTGQETAQLCNM